MKNQYKLIQIEGFIVVNICFFSSIFVIKILISEGRLFDHVMGLIAFFFIFLEIYILFIIFRDFILKPKEKILFLRNKNKLNSSLYNFFDEKGKKFEFLNSNILLENKYYLVKKTCGHIKEVISETDKNFEIKTKTSYWLNMYILGSYLENLFFLPIVYFIFFVGIVLLFTIDGVNKVNSLPFIVMPFLLIKYDYKKKKLKLKQEINNNFEENFEEKLEKTATVLNQITAFTISLFIFIQFKHLINNSNWIFISFAIFGLGIIFEIFSENKNYKKIYFLARISAIIITVSLLFIYFYNLL